MFLMRLVSGLVTFSPTHPLTHSLTRSTPVAANSYSNKLQKGSADWRTIRLRNTQTNYDSNCASNSTRHTYSNNK